MSMTVGAELSQILVNEQGEAADLAKIVALVNSLKAGGTGSTLSAADQATLDQLSTLAIADKAAADAIVAPSAPVVP